MTIKLCIFDMDGTLMDSENWFVSAATLLLENEKMPYGRDFLTSFIGLHASEQQEVFDRYHVPDEHIRIFYEKLPAYNDLYRKDHPIRTKEGVYELFEYLDKESIIKAMATTSLRSLVDYRMQDEDIRPYMADIVFGDDIVHPKPAPDCFEILLKRFSISPEEALVFEDSTYGILAAKAAGIPTVYIPDVANVKEEVRAQADYILSSLKDAIPLIDKLNKK